LGKGRASAERPTGAFPAVAGALSTAGATETAVMMELIHAVLFAMMRLFRQPSPRFSGDRPLLAVQLNNEERPFSPNK
jgi:hypothetical protein